jgi:hypothetical protein
MTDKELGKLWADTNYMETGYSGLVASLIQPITISENGPPSYPPHQHHQPDHDGNQQEQIGRFPNKYFADVHYDVLRLCIMQRVLLTHRIRFGRHSGR